MLRYCGLGRDTVILPDHGIWPGLFRLIDDHPEVSGLRFHGVAPLAVAHWHATGKPCPVSLKAELAAQAAVGMQAQALLQMVREQTDEPFLLIKGLEVAARYPDRSLRPLSDLDVLFRDPVDVQERFLASGWFSVPTPGFDVDPRRNAPLHQLCPLRHPGVALPVEMHRHPNWPTWVAPPRFDELAAAAVPADVGVDGVFVPCIEHHTLILLAHSWARQPLEQLSQLVDVALFLEECDRGTLDEIARKWKLQRLLDVEERTIDSVLRRGTSAPQLVRWFAPHLCQLTIPAGSRRQINRYAASVFLTPVPRAMAAMREGLARRRRVISRTVSRSSSDLERHVSESSQDSDA